MNWSNQALTPFVHSATSGPCINVSVRATFFFGELKPATSSLRSRYSSTFKMKSSALSLSPLKRGGFAPMALTFAAAATGWSACWAGGAPPPPPPPPPPPLPPPPLPHTAMWSSARSSVAERGWEDPVDALVCVVACVWVVVVVAIFGSWVIVEICGLFVTERTAGEFLMVLFNEAMLLDAVLDESLLESRS